MSSDALAALMAEPDTCCPHGMADASVCPDCLEPAAFGLDPLDLMRIPAEFRGATIATLPRATRSAIAPFIESWPPSRPVLWLGGNVGAGKSYTACAILRAVHRDYSVAGRFWPVSEVADAYRAASDPGYEGPWPAAVLDNALMTARLLVLDDFGAERASEFSTGKLYRVVDARYRERLPTIVTTNVDPGAIDPRIRSRLLSGIEVRFSGPDRRVTT